MKGWVHDPTHFHMEGGLLFHGRDSFLLSTTNLQRIFCCVDVKAPPPWFASSWTFKRNYTADSIFLQSFGRDHINTYRTVRTSNLFEINQTQTCFLNLILDVKLSWNQECCNPLIAARVFWVHWAVLKLGQYLFLSCPSPTCQNIHTSQTCRLNKGQPVQMTKHIPQSFPSDIFSTLMTRARPFGKIFNPGTTPDHFALLLFPDKVGADWHFRKQNSANMNVVQF